ncbi:MAG TPA: ATP-binding protein [Verrucomicrobiota bacterium]|nr:ATP-binding protein [Verrucomicrobiota bacterium]HNU50894.1 ATP-binding protein [Verrucomicrobiota bacterium]
MIREDRPWYPSRATREAIANSLCHRDYIVPGGAVAVAMYDDHLESTNPGRFHFGLKADDLSRPHASKPWNPLIASVFYRAGVIEQWGIGTLNILDWCQENGNPPPRWEEQPTGDIIVTFWPVSQADAKPPRQGPGRVTGEVTGEVGRLLQVLNTPMTRTAIQVAMGLKGQANFRDRYLAPALANGLIERTIPDKPQSRLQQYRLTEKDRTALERLKHEGRVRSLSI